MIKTCAQEEAAGEQNLVPPDPGRGAADIEQLMEILGLGKPQLGSFRRGLAPQRGQLCLHSRSADVCHTLRVESDWTAHNELMLHGQSEQDRGWLLVPKRHPRAPLCWLQLAPSSSIRGSALEQRCCERRRQVRVLHEDCVATFAAIPAALSPAVVPLLHLTLARQNRAASSSEAASSSTVAPLVCLSASTEAQDDGHHDGSSQLLVAFAAEASAGSGDALVCIVRVSPPLDGGDQRVTENAV